MECLFGVSPFEAALTEKVLSTVMLVYASLDVSVGVGLYTKSGDKGLV